MEQNRNGRGACWSAMSMYIHCNHQHRNHPSNLSTDMMQWYQWNLHYYQAEKI